jgi:hypothetical protein
MSFFEHITFLVLCSTKLILPPLSKVIFEPYKGNFHAIKKPRSRNNEALKYEF